jgi:hypothetical protein
MRPSRVGTTICANTRKKRAHKDEKAPLPKTGRTPAELHSSEERQAEKAGSTRERERERDASATLTRPIKDPPSAHRHPDTSFPKENTRTTTLSQTMTRFPLPESPSKALEPSHKDPTQTSLMYHSPPRPDSE